MLKLNKKEVDGVFKFKSSCDSPSRITRNYPYFMNELYPLGVAGNVNGG